MEDIVYQDKTITIVECGCCGRNHPDLAGDCRQWWTCTDCGDAHILFNETVVGPHYPY